MSGYKRATVTLTRDEYDRLRESADRLRILPEIKPQQTETISQQSLDALRRNLETIENRQVVFRHLITDFNGQIRTYEERNAKRLTSMQTEFTTLAQQYAGSLWDNVRSLISEQEQRQAEQLSQSRQETREVIAGLQNELNQITGNERRKHAIAEDWLAAAETLFAYLQENYACELFMPGRLDAVRRSLDLARQNLDESLAESAILSLQQNYFTLSDMHQEIERLENEWQMLLIANLETANQILVFAESSAYVQAVDLDGKPLPYEINVTYWSDGHLDRFVEDLHQFIDLLSGNEVPVSIETLQSWREQDLPAFYQRLQDIVLDARIQAINSQLRINIADLVVCALNEQGFQLMGAAYRASDERQAFMARMAGVDGSEVIVKVEPSGSDLGENELQLRSFDREERTEHELQQRWNEISRSLSGYGLNVGSYLREDTPGYLSSPKNHRTQAGKKTGPARHPLKDEVRSNGD